MQQQQDIQPAFEVEVLDGDEQITRSYFDDGVYKEVQETVPRGWMVYFPAGHSIRVRSESEMRRMGFNNAPNLLDMQSDEEGEIIAPRNRSLKENTKRKTKSRKSQPAATGGIMKDG